MPTTSNFGWTTPADTDLVKDGAAAIRTLGNGIDTSFLDLKGGTTDQVLAKNSNTDLDFKWVAVDPLTILDAKGDLISATAADTPARLAVGANDTVLTADSSTSTGLKWAAVATGGMTSISSGSLPTGTTTLTISSIPTTYNELLLQIYDIRGISPSNILRVRINNISTGSSYGAETDGYISAANLDAIQMNGTNNTFDATNSQIFAEVSFHNYAKTNAVKMGRFLYGNTADGIYTTGHWAQNSQNTTAITRIDVISSNANFGTGGSYTLWGIK